MEVYAPLGSNEGGARAADKGVVPVDRLFEEARAALGHALSPEERVKLLKALGCDGDACAVPASVIADCFAAMFGSAGGNGAAPPSPPAAAPAPDSSSTEVAPGGKDAVAAAAAAPPSAAMPTAILARDELWQRRAGGDDGGRGTFGRKLRSWSAGASSPGSLSPRPPPIDDNEDSDDDGDGDGGGSPNSASTPTAAATPTAAPTPTAASAILSSPPGSVRTCKHVSSNTLSPSRLPQPSACGISSSAALASPAPAASSAASSASPAPLSPPASSPPSRPPRLSRRPSLTRAPSLNSGRDYDSDDGGDGGAVRMVFEAVDATPLDALDEIPRGDDSEAERAAAPEHEYEYEDEDDWEVASTASIGSTASYRSHLSAATVDEVSLVPFRSVSFGCFLL